MIINRKSRMERKQMLQFFVFLWFNKRVWFGVNPIKRAAKQPIPLVEYGEFEHRDLDL